MMYAIMNLLGPGKLCQEYAKNKDFSVYLAAKDEMNHLFDCKSAKFGKHCDFAVLILYHLE